MAETKSSLTSAAMRFKRCRRRSLLSNSDHAVDLENLFYLVNAGRPFDPNTSNPRRPETKMQTQIVLRKITAAAADLIGLDPIARRHSNAGPNRAPIGLHPHQL